MVTVQSLSFTPQDSQNFAPSLVTGAPQEGQ